MDIKGLIEFAPRFIRARLTGGRFPVQMHIRVIDRCNLRCKYCFGDYPVRNLPAPTTEQIFAVLDGLGRMGTIRVTLTGGEPLLRDDIGAIVHRARENRIEPSLTTNGILIDRHPGLLEDLNQLTVSLDGGREVHDSCRGKGSWDSAIHAIEVARAAGTPVQLLGTVSRLTTPGLADVYAVADKYDCAVTFDLMAPYYKKEGGTKVREEAADDKLIRELLDTMIRAKNRRSVFSNRVLRYVRNWPYSYARYRLFRDQLPPGFRPIPCAAGRFFGIIETDGSLYPCCRTGAEYTPPNVYEIGIEEAWEQMPPHRCAACIQIGGNMFNSIFALQPDIAPPLRDNFPTSSARQGMEMKDQFFRVCIRRRIERLSNKPVFGS